MAPEQREAFGLDVVIGVAWLHQRVAPGSGKSVGIIPGDRCVQAGGSPSVLQVGVKRTPVLPFKSRSFLPFNRAGERPGKRGSARNLINPGDHQGLRDVEIRSAAHAKVERMKAEYAGEELVTDYACSVSRRCKGRHLATGRHFEDRATVVPGCLVEVAIRDLDWRCGGLVSVVLANHRSCIDTAW
jgi:hypothetical protein